MIWEDYKRASFKEILEILDPDLTCDFKHTSFYHNEYVTKLLSKKKVQDSASQESNLLSNQNKVKIAEPEIGNSDNYM